MNKLNSTFQRQLSWQRQEKNPDDFLIIFYLQVQTRVIFVYASMQVDENKIQETANAVGKCKNSNITKHYS